MCFLTQQSRRHQRSTPLFRRAGKHALKQPIRDAEAKAEISALVCAAESWTCDEDDRVRVGVGSGGLFRSKLFGFQILDETFEDDHLEPGADEILGCVRKVLRGVEVVHDGRGSGQGRREPGVFDVEIAF